MPILTFLKYDGYNCEIHSKTRFTASEVEEHP